MEKKFKRKRIWINTGFQLRLLLRSGGWLLGAFVLTLHCAFFLEWLWELMAAGGQRQGFADAYVAFMQRHRFIVYGWVVFLPYIMLDMVRFSHRIAGPLFRCRRMMGEMASGKAVPEFKPREGDLMPEFWEVFNGLIKHCNNCLNATSNGRLHHAESNGSAARVPSQAATAGVEPVPQQNAS